MPGIRSAGALMLIGLQCGACTALSPYRYTPGERVVTAEEIAATGATTGWEAVRRTIPGLSIHNGTTHHRGKSSVILTDRVALVVDGTRMSDFASLYQMPADVIETIHYLSGLDATTRYGTNAGDGMLVIRTKRGTD